ncbi:copper resistance CopC family protein [Nocardiopsis ansamitocini]|uniref:CopC domain-containing protein n=1 Tax=Nocardiopsis ansamitocini TaxID=1670832 RepID=A0A9W6P5T3_9ACTN|nr:copper resistance CopC family protein [Nocardiopsis ansamitocini]GLU47528.1 hypothetical protein Nans01_18790 [Nocardiopsis ansamitocini]
MSITPTSTTRRIGGLLAGVATAALLLVGPAPAAYAHDTLLSSSPKDGATVDSPPTEVELTFSADIGAGGNGIVVIGPDDQEYADGEISIDGAVATVQLAPVETAGEYTVNYRMISSDGHALEDAITFTVPESALPEPTPTESAPAGETPATSTASPAAGTNPVDDPLSPSGQFGDYGPAIAIVAGLAGIGLIAIVIIRLRRHGDSGN